MPAIKAQPEAVIKRPPGVPTDHVPLTQKGKPIPQSKGTGRKPCPHCKYFVAPTLELCNTPGCGHKFVKNPKTPPKVKQTDKDQAPTNEAVLVRTSPDMFDELKIIVKALRQAEKQNTPLQVTTEGSDETLTIFEPVKKPTIKEKQLYKLLNEKGFTIRRLRDEFTDAIVSEEIHVAIKNLELKFEEIPEHAQDGVYVVATSPQPQFACNLDTLIRIAKLKP